jgi:phosphate butyryltransferase
MKNFEFLFEKAKQGVKKRIIVAAAEDDNVLLSIKDAVEHNIIEPIFVGNKAKINKISEEIGFDVNMQ